VTVALSSSLTVSVPHPTSGWAPSPTRRSSQTTPYSALTEAVFVSDSLGLAVQV
jgi:hypothetical protein